MLQRIDFASLARQLLKDRRYTTHSLGKAVGLSQPSVSRLAAGKTTSVSADVGINLILLAGGSVQVPLEDAEIDGAR